MSDNTRWRRVGALVSTPGIGWSVRSDHEQDARLQHAGGALLGLVVGEQLRSASPPQQLTGVAATALAIAERLTDAQDVHRDEIARAIVDHATPDERYDRDLLALFALWERGVPVPIAASQIKAPDGIATDFAAAVLPAAAIRHVDDHDRLLESVVAYAEVMHADPVGVDGAVAFTVALAAALRGEDPLDTACAATATLQLRDRLQAARVLRHQRARPGSLREHFQTGCYAPDCVAVAIYCATSAATFASALHKAGCATDDANAVQALTGALAGARFGTRAIPTRLLNAVPPAAHARALRAAADLLDCSNATLPRGLL